MEPVYAQQGDTVDAICQRYYGYTRGITEDILKANPGLADIGPVLPIGHKVLLPIAKPQPIKTTVKLWD